jgi:hypothetical protein
VILAIIYQRLGPPPLHNARDSAAISLPCHTATARKILRNDVWTTHLLVFMSASGLVSIVFGPVNDDLKHHVGLVHTWEHPAFNFVSNPTLFVTRTTLHNSPSRHKQCVADRPQNGVG